VAWKWIDALEDDTARRRQDGDGRYRGQSAAIIRSATISRLKKLVPVAAVLLIFSPE